MREELTAATPLEDAFLRIAYLEDHVRKLTEDLYNVRASFFLKKKRSLSIVSRTGSRRKRATSSRFGSGKVRKFEFAATRRRRSGGR